MLPGYRSWRGRPRGGTAIRWPADRVSASGAQAHAQRRRHRKAAPPNSRSGRGFPRRVAIPAHKHIHDVSSISPHTAYSVLIL